MVFNIWVHLSICVTRASLVVKHVQDQIPQLTGTLSLFQAEVGDAPAPAPAEGIGEEGGDIMEGKDALPDVPMTPSGSELGAEQDDEDDDDDSERRNQSISKKLWSFFTT